ncbi:unnamed protein product [Symbiodinium microadriaticum]|nr:unnamed protein product [Symbiodinium microadriaticum]CAE7938880.1 unnamed protein product [Symbiodinium sp. KB8]
MNQSSSSAESRGGPRVAAGGSLSRATDFNGSRERERESDVLLSGRSEGEGLREAGQTLRNPFAETFPEQEDGQSLPFELRSCRIAARLEDAY